MVAELLTDMSLLLRNNNRAIFSNAILVAAFHAYMDFKVMTDLEQVLDLFLIPMPYFLTHWLSKETSYCRFNRSTLPYLLWTHCLSNRVTR